MCVLERAKGLSRKYRGRRGNEELPYVTRMDKENMYNSYCSREKGYLRLRRNAWEDIIGVEWGTDSPAHAKRIFLLLMPIHVAMY